MKQFDYNEYNKLAKALDEYYESCGLDFCALIDIHDELGEIYEEMREGLELDEDMAFQTIENFVKECIKIKDAFYYPIMMQECLQVLIMIATYPLEDYEPVGMAAYDAAHIFHTHIFHPGE